MKRSTTPFDYWKGGMELSLLAAETQMVIAYRVLGMAGFWAVAGSENRLMCDEKAPAFAKAAAAATAAALAGHRPDEVVGAWVAPLRHRTSANVRRLGRRGPRLA